MRWYQDPDIAELLRHDLKPLTTIQARGYFDSIVLPASSAGTAWAIHDRVSGNLIGTTAVTQVNHKDGTCLFRIVIGEKQAWGHGFGTEATQLVAAEVFETLGLDTIMLEVFDHNPRAHHVYERIGFVETGRSVEWVWHRRLDVIAMELTRATWEDAMSRGDSTSG
jgi:RimJ/RimL family protein N-acetyltransferase